MYLVQVWLAVALVTEIQVIVLLLLEFRPLGNFLLLAEPSLEILLLVLEIVTLAIEIEENRDIYQQENSAKPDEQRYCRRVLQSAGIPVARNGLIFVTRSCGSSYRVGLLLVFNR